MNKPDSAPPKPWVTPRLVRLPRLTHLTLQSTFGSEIGGGASVFSGD
jgi:hypothetical protein